MLMSTAIVRIFRQTHHAALEQRAERRMRKNEPTIQTISSITKSFHATNPT